LKELIASSDGFEVREIYLKGRENLLEMLLKWKESSENTIYFVHGIGNQFPWVLPYLNLHRDLFFDIKRPVVVVGNEYEIKEIQKHAPDWFRFRSRTYELKEEELGEERGIMRLAEPTESKPIYYPLPVFEENGEEEIKERIKIDEYLLSSESDDYKLAELYMSLSLSHFKLGDFERGEEYLRKSKAIRAKLKDNKGILLNYVRLFSIFVGIGEFEKAIGACNQALKLNPNFTEVYIDRGLSYAKLNQYGKAIEDFDKAIALNSDYTTAYYNRGNAYAELNQYKRAIKDFDKTIALSPNYANAYTNRGAAYHKLNKYGWALEDYRKAIALNPMYAVAYRNRGITYSKIGRYEESAWDFKKAGILFFYSNRMDDLVNVYSICFDLRAKIEGEDVIYSGLALSLITKDANIGEDLRRMRIQDKTMRKIFEFALMKLRGEDISDGIAMLEEKEKTGEMKILFELLKRF